MGGNEGGDGVCFVGADVDEEVVVRGDVVHGGGETVKVGAEGDEGGGGEDVPEESEFATVVELSMEVLVGG